MLPFVIGATVFFVIPLIQSLIFSFEEIKISSKGFASEFVFFENYLFAFTKDPDYLKILATSLQNMLYEVPIIVIFSLFIAIILNQNFKGRTVARAIMFLPVIISSGIIITILKEDVFAQTILKQGSADASFIFQGTGIEGVLRAANLNEDIIEICMNVIGRIFDTLWKTGVQILLFLSILQSVPRTCYEVAQVEGSTAWETFWLITFPLVSPMILVNIVYTIVDSFSDYANPVLQTINDTAFSQMRYGYSSALAWIYFICVFLIIGLVFLVLKKRVFYMAG
ncbi:MAG: carbohydrate ABC transporter permease [Acutalibacteraceae bacterium]